LWAEPGGGNNLLEYEFSQIGFSNLVFAVLKFSF